MVFSSIMFVFVFLPVIIVSYSAFYYFFIHNNRRNAGAIHMLNSLLLLFSLIFYAWGEPNNIAILIICTLVNYLIALIIPRIRHKKTALALGISVNLGLLLYYKYAMLLFSGKSLDFINSIIPEKWYFNDVLNITLPLGISFYIFQAISYLIDIYRREVKPAKNIIDFACYLTMFPQLVAGPIVRYSQVACELRDRTITPDLFARGVSRFIIGLAKKVLIADTLGKVADAAFVVPAGELPMYAAWIGIICYTLQIYYDFSGYSDMAIGMGKMFGFSFPENFNYPYIANSIQNFWTRWHMSLSTWFKDYLYISLGGNRKGALRTYLNLFIVFLLCGFWHGARWNFLAWGAYYGLFLIFERIYPKFITAMPRALRHIYVIAIVMAGWVLFKADSFPHAFAYYKSLLGLLDAGLEIPVVNLNWYGYDVDIALIFAMLFSMPIYQYAKKWCKERRERTNNLIVFIVRFIHYCLLLGIFFLCVYPIFGASYKAFIYFRF